MAGNFALHDPADLARRFLASFGDDCGNDFTDVGVLETCAVERWFAENVCHAQPPDHATVLCAGCGSLWQVKTEAHTAADVLQLALGLGWAVIDNRCYCVRPLCQVAANERERVVAESARVNGLVPR